MKIQVAPLVLLVALIVLLSIPLEPVHAFGPELVQVKDGFNAGCSGAGPQTCTLAFNSNVVNGNYVIIAFGGGGQPCRPGDITIVTDTFGTNYGAAKITADDSSDLAGASLYVGKLTASGADTISITSTHGTSPCTIDLWELAGPSLSNTTPSATANNVVLGSAGSPFQTSSSNTLSAGNFAVAFIWSNGAGTGSAGTSFTSILHFAGGNLLVGAQYSDTVASPTLYPVNCLTGPCSTSTATFVEVGMIMPTQAFVVVQTTLVQACTFTQLQCWWYPMLFLGMYLGFFVAPAMVFKFSEKGFAYFTLAGATYASLIEISLGTMNATVPIMFIVINVAYSFRLDRIITSLTSR